MLMTDDDDGGGTEMKKTTSFRLGQHEISKPSFSFSGCLRCCVDPLSISHVCKLDWSNILLLEIKKDVKGGVRIENHNHKTNISKLFHGFMQFVHQLPFPGPFRRLNQFLEVSCIPVAYPNQIK